jgi:hypothetical protein
LVFMIFFKIILIRKFNRVYFKDGGIVYNGHEFIFKKMYLFIKSLIQNFVILDVDVL